MWVKGDCKKCRDNCSPQKLLRLLLRYNQRSLHIGHESRKQLTNFLKSCFNPLGHFNFGLQQHLVKYIIQSFHTTRNQSNSNSGNLPSFRPNQLSYSSTKFFFFRDLYVGWIFSLSKNKSFLGGNNVSFKLLLLYTIFL